MAKSSPFVKRSQNRYDLNDFMNSKQGLLNSAAPVGPSGRLNADSLQRLPGGLNAEAAPDGQSIRSKRSLSINVNKVSKIVKMNDDGVSAISKVKKSDAGTYTCRARVPQTGELEERNIVLEVGLT